MLGEENLISMWTNIANLSDSLDYIFQLAVEMHKLGLPWTSKSGLVEG